MWDHIKENKILFIGFIVCLILAAYVSEKKKADEEQARIALGDQTTPKTETMQTTDDAIDASMALPCGDILQINI